MTTIPQKPKTNHKKPKVVFFDEDQLLARKANKVQFKRKPKHKNRQDFE